MKMSLPIFLTLLYCATVVQANVEKTIFKAPDSTALPDDASQAAALDSLLLMTLHPDNLVVRTHLNASFPKDQTPHGEETWALLEGLTPGQRYELRVCWLATQPTSFWLDTFTISETFETPELISSLSSYAYIRRRQLSMAEVNHISTSRYKRKPAIRETSLLFLRIQAAADYFSLNKTLMEHVPPVHVDLILDAYLLNIFPQSLVPTAGYIAVIAVIAFFLSRIIYQQLNAYIDRSRAEEERSRSKKSL